RSPFSNLPLVTQTPREFDFPGAPWPPEFHYAGPFHDEVGREPVAFPWETLTGAPLIYASLGTLVNGQSRVYGAILRRSRHFRRPRSCSRSVRASPSTSWVRFHRM